jgi:hypothetical protein
MFLNKLENMALSVIMELQWNFMVITALFNLHYSYKHKIQNYG